MFYVLVAALLIGLASGGFDVPAATFLLAVPLLLGVTVWGLSEGYGEARSRGSSRLRSAASSPAMALKLWFKLGL